MFEDSLYYLNIFIAELVPYLEIFEVEHTLIEKTDIQFLTPLKRLEMVKAENLVGMARLGHADVVTLCKSFLFPPNILLYPRPNMSSATTT